MRPLLIHPAPVPPEVAQVLDLGERAWVAVGSVDDLARLAPVEGWGGAIVQTDGDAEAAWALCQALRAAEPAVAPIMLLVSGRQLDDLATRNELFDDFCLTPFHPREFERRLEHALWRDGDVTSMSELITYEELVLNVDTYEAAIAGTPLELTYMEYELLRYLASNPGRVFTREVLLSQVWGYDYFGGARTVDVHIRRLRSKLGEDHAGMIQTVRSVGYSLGKSRWQT
ncbi:MAG: response regulator transcription factor [Actinomycetota bacterium]